jgi:hypothetical protein
MAVSLRSALQQIRTQSNGYKHSRMGCPQARPHFLCTTFIGTFKATAEQEAVIDAVVRGGDLKIRAYAGAGKTSAPGLVANQLAGSSYLAFNREARPNLLDFGPITIFEFEKTFRFSNAFDCTCPGHTRLRAIRPTMNRDPVHCVACPEEHAARY